MIVKLFIIFFYLGFFSFGGGYAMIPLVEQQFEAHSIFLDPLTVSNLTAISGMAPGPVGINLANAFGYNVAGILGGLVSVLAVAISSLILVTIAAKLFNKVYCSEAFVWCLYGLRPVVVGIIISAALNMVYKNNVFFDYTTLTSGITASSFFGSIDLASVVIFGVTIISLIKGKINPIFLIIAGGVAGAIFC